MEKTEREESLFDRLARIDCSAHIETKQNASGVSLSYLSWSWAWQIFKQHCPDAEFHVMEYDGKPYLFDENLGYMVAVRVITGKSSHVCRLPVMDNANKAMKNVPYEYATRNGKKTVAAATMFDINTAIQRCLVKCLALFGLGLYIYAGEDLPQITEEQAVNELGACSTLAELADSCRRLKEAGFRRSTLVDIYSKRREEIVEEQKGAETA